MLYMHGCMFAAWFCWYYVNFDEMQYFESIQSRRGRSEVIRYISSAVRSRSGNENPSGQNHRDAPMIHPMSAWSIFKVFTIDYLCDFLVGCVITFVFDCLVYPTYRSLHLWMAFSSYALVRFIPWMILVSFRAFVVFLSACFMKDLVTGNVSLRKAFASTMGCLFTMRFTRRRD